MQSNGSSGGDATKPTISLSDDVESAPGPHPAILDGSLQKKATTVEPILDSDDTPRPAVYYVDGEDDARERKLEQGTGTSRPSKIAVTHQRDRVSRLVDESLLTCTEIDRINRETPDQMGNQLAMAQSGLSLVGEDRLTNSSDEDEENQSYGSVSVGNFEEPVVPIDADLEVGDYLVEAYIVPDETVYEATPTQPWFEQRKMKLMIAAILALLAVLAVSLSVAFTREPVLQTNEPTFSPAPSASSTSLPSISSAPSLSCESKVLATKKQFDLLQKPEDIKDVKVSIDGVDAAVVWHDGKPQAKLYVYFFQLSERRRDWDQTAFFQEDLTTALGKDDFDVSMSGNVAVVGVFPQNRTITYRRRGNNWEESIRMNLPDMTSFSFRDGLLVVTAGVCNLITSCMGSASFFKQRDGNWQKTDEMTTDDGDYFDVLIDVDLVVLRYRTGLREDDCSSSFYKLNEGKIVMHDQRPIKGCGQMVLQEGMLAHAVDGGVVMHEEDGSAFVAYDYFTPGKATVSELELSLHNNVLAVADDYDIKFFLSGTGEDAKNWTEIIELDFFNAGLFYDSFDVFGGFLAVVEGNEVFTFDLSRFICSGSIVMIRIQYDYYPGDTSYKLKKILSGEGQETEVASRSGSVAVQDENYDESICLGYGLYSFSFHDFYGDGFRGEYSLTLVSGETIIKRENGLRSLYGEEVLFRLPFDRETLDVRMIGSDGLVMPSVPVTVPLTFQVVVSGNVTAEEMATPGDETRQSLLLAVTLWSDAVARGYFDAGAGQRKEKRKKGNGRPRDGARGLRRLGGPGGHADGRELIGFASPLIASPPTDVSIVEDECWGSIVLAPGDRCLLVTANLTLTLVDEPDGAAEPATAHFLGEFERDVTTGLFYLYVPEDDRGVIKAVILEPPKAAAELPTGGPAMPPSGPVPVDPGDGDGGGDPGEGGGTSDFADLLKGLEGDQTPEKSGGNAGAIAAGVLVPLAVLAAAGLFVMRRRRTGRTLRQFGSKKGRDPADDLGGARYGSRGSGRSFSAGSESDG
ncbi:hypothetical protein THAOC_32231, partial [Thalassiosira oceanica]